MGDDFKRKKQINELTKELLNANKIISNDGLEKEKRAAELADANKTIVFQSKLIRVQMEKQLLEKTLMCIGDAIIATDINSKIRLFNKAAKTITGWTQKEAFRNPIHKTYNIKDEHTSEKVKNIIAEVIASGEVHQEDNPNVLITKTGSEIRIENTTALIINELTYKKALSKDEAIEEIRRCSGTQFDPELAELFIEQVLKTK